MANIEKRYIIDAQKLNGEYYFKSLIQEAQANGLLNDSDIENIMLQCISLLAYKCEEYNLGNSSSIRTEIAETIMESNLYTIGLYLKTFPNPDSAVSELKKEKISSIYDKGYKLINSKFQDLKRFYKIVKSKKVETPNYTYNHTLSDKGIGIFFRSYNKSFMAHDVPASIDYQLFNTISELTGIEYIHHYFVDLYLENEFCQYFDAVDIHYLLYGYDKNYQHLLINIFEFVLTAALGCVLAERNIRHLSITKEDIQIINEKLNKNSLYLILKDAAVLMCKELVTLIPTIRDYIENSLQKIVVNIENASRLNSLDKVFIIPKNPDSEPKIIINSEVKMQDSKYRCLIEELQKCRFTSDKLALIKEKIKSFDDLDDLLLDMQFDGELFLSLFNTLSDVEIAALIKRHPYLSDVQAIELSEAEKTLQLNLFNYINQLSLERKEKIVELTNYIV